MGELETEGRTMFSFSSPQGLQVAEAGGSRLATRHLEDVRAGEQGARTIGDPRPGRKGAQV